MEKIPPDLIDETEVPSQTNAQISRILICGLTRLLSGARVPEMHRVRCSFTLILRVKAQREFRVFSEGWSFALKSEILTTIRMCSLKEGTLELSLQRADDGMELTQPSMCGEQRAIWMGYGLGCKVARRRFHHLERRAGARPLERTLTRSLMAQATFSPEAPP